MKFMRYPANRQNEGWADGQAKRDMPPQLIQNSPFISTLYIYVCGLGSFIALSLGKPMNAQPSSRLFSLPLKSVLKPHELIYVYGKDHSLNLHVQLSSGALITYMVWTFINFLSLYFIKSSGHAVLSEPLLVLILLVWILYVPVSNFQSCPDWSSWVEPVLSRG